MNIFKKLIAAAVLSAALLIPSAHTEIPEMPSSSYSITAYASDKDEILEAPEAAAQLYDNTEAVDKSTEKKEKKEYNPVKSFLISLVISVIIAFIAVGSMKSKLKTVRRQSGASNYTKKDSLKLEINSDTYLYNKIEKTARNKS